VGGERGKRFSGGKNGKDRTGVVHVSGTHILPNGVGSRDPVWDAERGIAWGGTFNCFRDSRRQRSMDGNQQGELMSVGEEMYSKFKQVDHMGLMGGDGRAS